MNRCLAGLIRRALIFCSDEVPLGKEIPDSAVEHACIEVDTLIPREQHENLLLIDQRLVFFVVLLDDVLPIRSVEEVVAFLDHLFEEVISFGAVMHRFTEEIFRAGHNHVSILVPLVMVLTERSFEMAVEMITLLGAVF